MALKGGTKPPNSQWGRSRQGPEDLGTYLGSDLFWGFAADELLKDPMRPGGQLGS